MLSLKRVFNPSFHALVSLRPNMVFTPVRAIASYLKNLDLQDENYGMYNGTWGGSGSIVESIDPSTNKVIAKVIFGTPEEYDSCIQAMDNAKSIWAEMPAPARGEIVRKIGEQLRIHKKDLGKLISLEMGKILSEGEGEVQEAIDICDFAVGLSRSLNGSVIPSERPGHFMMERWHPLNKHVGIVTAFNFPCAVFFWNAAISLVCGNTQIWKGAESTSLVTIACQKIVNNVLEKEDLPRGIATMIQGPGNTVGQKLVEDERIEMVSFTGSTQVGLLVSQIVASRFGKQILELGGNNAMVVMDDADVEMALRATLFSAIGTTGQRCTSLRRIYLHENIYDSFLDKLVKAYGTVHIGSPLDPTSLCGPLHNPNAVQQYLEGIAAAEAQGGKVVYGNKVLDVDGNFVQPTLITISHSAPCIQHELFVPVLYIIKINSLDEAIKFNNDVPQGLSSSLFTKNQTAMFQWTGALGSDCGIVNVNIGPSGAEIGGAFGGEKATGGGRESGSDSWKQYCRRSTCTINYSDQLPLAQGVQF